MTQCKAVSIVAAMMMSTPVHAHFVQSPMQLYQETIRQHQQSHQFMDRPPLVQHYTITTPQGTTTCVRTNLGTGFSTLDCN